MPTLCFVLMPFGTKTDGNKKEIDFDKVYNSFIKKAIIEAGLEPIRADEEKGGGFIHKPMYERLMFCDFAVADLSFANANVFYELGIRHALKPFTTVSIFEVNTKLPFDTAPLRTIPYNYDNGEIQNVDEKIKALAGFIKGNLDAVKIQHDSPIGQLIQGYKFPDLKILEQDADAFTSNVLNVKNQKETLKELAKEWKAADNPDKQATINKIVQIEKEEGSGLKFNYDLLYAILDAYKSVSAFKEIARMLKPLVAGDFKNNIYIKQQLGLAYNKSGNREEAEAVLKTITDQFGPDPETNGLLGAVYKGLMDDNKDDADVSAAYRSQAIDAYLNGFEADPRDFYPGINALTLMFFNEEPDERFGKFLPLVKYAVERQLRTKAKDYWVQATALELAALGLNESDSKKFYAASITCQPAPWMKETTANNLKKIYDKALTQKDVQSLEWLQAIIQKLNQGS